MPEPDPTTTAHLDQLAQRVQLLEAYVSHLYRTTGVAMPSAAELLAGGPASGGSPALAEIQAIARSGNKIEAIKRYRELTGTGLAEAKAVVDSW